MIIIIITNNFLDYSYPGISLFSFRIAMGKKFSNTRRASSHEKSRKVGAGGEEWGMIESKGNRMKIT